MHCDEKVKHTSQNNLICEKSKIKEKLWNKKNLKKEPKESGLIENKNNIDNIEEEEQIKMALKKVKGNFERMFDKNLTDLVRGIRNNKDNEVNSINKIIPYGFDLI